MREAKREAKAAATDGTTIDKPDGKRRSDSHDRSIKVEEEVDTEVPKAKVAKQFSGSTASSLSHQIDRLISENQAIVASAGVSQARFQEESDQ